MNISLHRHTFIRRWIAGFVLISVLSDPFTSYTKAETEVPFRLPPPGNMVKPSVAVTPVLLKGMRVFSNNPFKFEFYIDSGSSGASAQALQKESEKLIKYFLAAMTVPQGNLWVNLSPFEKERIVPEALGRTELGKDLLAQDYLLKQLSATLIYPETDLGKEFWTRVFQEIKQKYGDTEIPLGTMYNRVWIVPDRAVVYEDVSEVYIGETHLRVMLDEDYWGEHNNPSEHIHTSGNGGTVSALSTNIFRQVILPEIEKEVNQGKNFAGVRQMFYALILAKWYKEIMRNSPLYKVYVDQNKIAGVNLSDVSIKDQIFERYLQAFKKGVFNLIKEDNDQDTNEFIPRKYFSGGFDGIGFTIQKRALGSKPLAYVGSRYRLSLEIEPIGQSVRSSPGSSSSVTDFSGTVSHFLRTPDLTERKQLLIMLEEGARQGDPVAGRFIDIALKIRKAFPSNTSYDVDDEIVRLLPKAIRIVNRGGDFEIIYTPPVPQIAEDRIVSPDPKRWEYYGKDEYGADLYIDYLNGEIRVFSGTAPDLHETFKLRYPSYRATNEKPEQILITEAIPHSTDELDSTAHGELTNITEEMKRIRAELAKGEYDLSADKLAQIRERLFSILAGHPRLRSEYTSLYFLVDVMSRKIVKGHPWLFSQGAVSRATQIILMDHSRQRVLLQKRGPYKRLFAGKLTVSANTKETDPAKLATAAVLAVKNEVGIDILEDQIALVGDRESYQSTLISYDLQALDPSEAAQLESEVNKLNAKQKQGHIAIVYDPVKKAAFVYSIDHQATQDQVRAVARLLSERTSVPFMYPVFTRANNSLVVVHLTADQEKEIESLAAQKNNLIQEAVEHYGSIGLTSEFSRSLDMVDTDSMDFYDWLSVYEQAREHPEDFAQDLTSPYFPFESFWNSLHIDRPEMIALDHPLAQSLPIVGGKGRNTAILEKLSKSEAGLRIPPSHLITTFAYEKYVLQNPDIRKKIAELDDPGLSADELTEKAGQVKRMIREIVLPPEFERQIIYAAEALGGRVAIRSSATMEDLKEYAAAGQADSFLNVVDPAEMIRRVKDVWASLFNVSFLNDRRTIQPGKSQVEYRMAVLLQGFVDSGVAGAAKTIAQFGRPVIHINAMPGLAEAVVEGEGSIDTWDVNLTADSILERNITPKKVKIVARPGGGIEKTDVIQNGPSLSDAQILALAKVIRTIQNHYRQNHLAQYVDIEFAFASDGQPVILQARSENIDESKPAGKNAQISLEVVDEKHVPPGTKTIHLNTAGISASLGTVKGKLKIIDREYGIDQVETGSIVVTLHTNNEWNDAFAKMGGIITADGGDTSHAAKNSRRLGIPSFVGASGCQAQLREFDGQDVTFDSVNKVVYIGLMPTKTIQTEQTFWAETEDQYIDNLAGRDTHELYKPWIRNRADRYTVFRDYFDGSFRLRSGTYPYFELDYYYQAWDRLTRYLNNRFSDRRAWELKPQARLIRDSHLYHQIKPGGEGNIHAYLSSVRDVNIDDLAELFEERYQGFRRFGDFMAGIDKLDKDNIGPVTDELIEIFTWMHFAFWLNAALNIDYLPEQIASLSPEFQDAFRDAAVSDFPREKRTDVSRNKDKEFFAILEEIRSSAELENAFILHQDPVNLAAYLRENDPRILNKIEQWSMRYKKDSENILDLSDTSKYLKDMQERIQSGLLAPRELVSRLFEDQPGPIDAEKLMTRDPDLYQVLRGQARLQAAMARDAAFLEKSGAVKRDLLNQVREADIVSSFPKAVEKIEQDIALKEKKVAMIFSALKHFPNLKKTLALSKRETLLREDGHHLIVPLQRKLARMMIDAAGQFRDTIGEESNIFQLSTAELVALFKEDAANRGYLAHSFARKKIEDFADKQLRSAWKTDPQSAVTQFNGSIQTAIRILRDQTAASKIPEAVDYFNKEIDRLQARGRGYLEMAKPVSSSLVSQNLSGARSSQVGGIDFNEIDLNRKGYRRIPFSTVSENNIPQNNIIGMWPVILEFVPDGDEKPDHSARGTDDDRSMLEFKPNYN